MVELDVVQNCTYSEGMKFTWDPNKNDSNEIKHGLRFEFAREVFADPRHKTQWNGIYGDEERWLTIGLLEGCWIIVVIHTDRDAFGEEIVRIISARKATRAERRFYEQGHDPR